MIVSCKTTNNNTGLQKIKLVKYVLEDKIISIDTLLKQSELKIVYNGDVILYEVPSIELKVFGTTIDSGRLIKKFLPYDTTYSYYIIKEGFNQGLQYDSAEVITPNVFKKDSLLKSINLDMASLNVYGIDLGKPISVIKGRNFQIEKYGKLLEADPDSIYRYYDSGLNNLPFSFSPLLDKEKNKKLWKTVFIYHRSKDKNNRPKPRIEAITKIEEIKDYIPKVYLYLFQRFEKESILIKPK